ncbi:MAG: hypothetical protein V4692_05205, partial [Bdellovibrionota bacterium]
GNLTVQSLTGEMYGVNTQKNEDPEGMYLGVMLAEAPASLRKPNSISEVVGPFAGLSADRSNLLGPNYEFGADLNSAVIPGSNDVISAVGSYNHTLCYATRSNGAYCVGGLTARYVGTPVPRGSLPSLLHDSKDVIEIAPAWHDICVRKKDGKVFCREENRPTKDWIEIPGL